MDEVAGAIADPVRREILELLRDNARLSAGQIAERFPISRPAVSRHLRVLRESGLVRDELVGRQRFYLLDAARLTPLARWLASFDRPAGWAHRLDALETVYQTPICGTQPTFKVKVVSHDHKLAAEMSIGTGGTRPT